MVDAAFSAQTLVPQEPALQVIKSLESSLTRSIRTTGAYALVEENGCICTLGQSYCGAMQLWIRQ